MEQKGSFCGKKTFLLYPHSVVRDDMLDLLVMAGFETYTLLDEVKAKKLLAKFPDSIMFVNIDEGMKEPQWEAYLKNIITDPKTKNSRIGIMSYNQDKELMKKYLMELALPCGYVQLKLGLQQSTEIILKALEANEARGRRNAIRADCQNDISATINYKNKSDFYHGKILDISSVGLAAKFDKLPEYPINSILRQVQLKLHGGIVMADLIFIAQRPENKFVQVLLFDPKTPTDIKLVINRYMKYNLQKYINGLSL